MVCKEVPVIKENVRGGKGHVIFYYIMSENELMGHATMYARVVIPPHCSIGLHQHIGNTEPYYILSGEGIFTDADGSKVTVHAGDICKIECGESHAIENESEEDLVMMALIINEGPKA